MAGAAKREWTKDKKTLTGLKDDYPSASADTLSDAKDLAGEDDPTDLADLNAFIESGSRTSTREAIAA